MINDKKFFKYNPMNFIFLILIIKKSALIIKLNYFQKIRFKIKILDGLIKKKRNSDNGLYLFYKIN